MTVIAVASPTLAAHRARPHATHVNLSVPELYEHAVRASARASSRTAGRWSCGPASTPAARPRTSTSSTSRAMPRRRLVGRLQPAHQRGALRRAAARDDRPPRRARAVRPGLLRRRRSALPALGARLHRDGLGEHLLRQPVPDAQRRRGPGGFAPELHHHRRAQLPGRPRARRRPQRDGHPRPPRRARRSSSAAPSTPARSRRAPSAS